MSRVTVKVYIFRSLMLRFDLSQTVDELVSYAALNDNPSKEFIRLRKAIGTPAVLLMVSAQTKSKANAALNKILDKDMRRWIREFSG